MFVKGCCVDTIAGFMSDFIEQSAGPFEAWLTILQHSTTHSYTPISSLALPMTDPTFREYPSGSSDWLQSHDLIAVNDAIKRTLLLAMKTSIASVWEDGSLTTGPERLDSFWRTLIGNRTAEGAIPPPEWVKMFNVLLNGPEFLPPHLNGSITSTSRISCAQVYVRPFFKVLFAGLSDRSLFIMTRGMLGLANKAATKGDMVCVFFGCSFPVVVRKEKDFYKRSSSVRTEEIEEIEGEMYGKAYLSGYMDGRAVTEIGNGKLEGMSFWLH